LNNATRQPDRFDSVAARQHTSRVPSDDRPIVIIGVGMSCRALWVSVLSVLALAGCPRPVVEPVADAGTNGEQFLVCSNVSECLAADPNATEQTVRCDGVCLYICNGVDEACPDVRQFCDVNGTCAFGCRDSSTCGAGEVCRAGICQVSAAECASKCDCDPGEVCTDEQCVPAGATCSGGADCPRGPLTPTDQCEAFQCNGFTDQCFDPDPSARLCTQASECVGRPGCVGGAVCTCTASGACVPDVACTIQNESTTCGFGNFCDGDGRCQPLPACTGPDDCTGGLVCNGGTGFCERSQPCTISTDCGIAPNTFCANNFCTVPTCTNNAITCTAPQVCNPQGRCAAPGTGVACTGDGTCLANQYCDVPNQECAVGCRNNASCGSGQVCDGNRQCVAAGGGTGGQFGDPCLLSDECQAPMICGLITAQCAEPCATPADCVACNAALGTCRCNGFGFCAP